MNRREKKGIGVMTLVEAIETLSNIADLEVDQAIGVAEKHDATVQAKPFSYRTVKWLHNKNAESTINAVKDTFRSVLNYLIKFYAKDYDNIENEQVLEGIKTIMVLVGEAAKKLDKCSKSFQKAQHNSITELKEYKKLQEFYLTRVARKIDEGTLGKWVLALSNKVYSRRKTRLSGHKKSNTTHVFVDLDSVKKDTEYDLFYIRKEDGSRFFSPRLIRNVKLVSNFEGYLGEVKDDDILSDVIVWQDRVAHMCAKNIVGSIVKVIEDFYHKSLKHNDDELFLTLNKALMALLLACNPQNLVHHLPHKSCRDYFLDFHLFLRQSLRLDEYQKMIAYPPNKSNQLANCLLNTVHSLCFAFYTELTGFDAAHSWVHSLIDQAKVKKALEHQDVGSKSDSLSSQLAGDYATMTALIKQHPNGPVNKILDALEEGKIREFDPTRQISAPRQLFGLYAHEGKVSFASWPSPTSQEFIHKVSVNEEFKGFLRELFKGQREDKCLVLNFQDRSSWKDVFRSAAIEEIPDHESFKRQISVATLAKDTEFYHQLPPYNLDNHVGTFIKTFKKQLTDDGGGYLFPESMQKELLGNFVDGVLEGVHQIFFSGKNVLSREDRMDFIEIFYLFLQLKIVELSKADIVGYCCKDGIDVSQAALAQLFIFLKLLGQERMSEYDREHLDLMIYGPSLLYRERLMLPERFNRMERAIRTIESVRRQAGEKGFIFLIKNAFGKFYKTHILEGKISIERSKDGI